MSRSSAGANWPRAWREYQERMIVWAWFCGLSLTALQAQAIRKALCVRQERQLQQKPRLRVVTAYGRRIGEDGYQENQP